MLTHQSMHVVSMSGNMRKGRFSRCGNHAQMHMHTCSHEQVGLHISTLLHTGPHVSLSRQ